MYIYEQLLEILQEHANATPTVADEKVTIFMCTRNHRESCMTPVYTYNFIIVK